MDNLEQLLYEYLAAKSNAHFLGGKPNRLAIKKVAETSLKPLLAKGEYKLPNSIHKRREFAGELLALTCYEKCIDIRQWRYEPLLIDDGRKLTPDFLINNSTYVEVYSPSNSLSSLLLSNLKESKISGKTTAATGFHPEPAFDHRILIKTLREKTNKYHKIPITFLVCTFTRGFPVDIVRSINQVSLSPKHRIVYMHGSNYYYVYPKGFEVGLQGQNSHKK